MKVIVRSELVPPDGVYLVPTSVAERHRLPVMQGPRLPPAVIE